MGGTAAEVSSKACAYHVPLLREQRRPNPALSTVSEPSKGLQILGATCVLPTYQQAVPVRVLWAVVKLLLRGLQV